MIVRSANFFQMAAAVALFSTALPASRTLTQQVPPVLGVALRMLIAAVVLSPVLIYRRRELRELKRADVGLVAALALFGMVGMSLVMVCSVGLVSCRVFCLITSMTPLVTYFGARLILRDGAHRGKFAAVLIAVIAAALIHIAGNYIPDDCPTAGLALAGGCAMVFVGVCCDSSCTLIGRGLRNRVSPLTIAALSCAIAASALLIVATPDALAFDWSVVSPISWLAAVWWGAASLAAGSWLWYRGVHVCDGGTAATFLSTMPFISWLLAGWLPFAA